MSTVLWLIARADPWGPWTIRDLPAVLIIVVVGYLVLCRLGAD
jgi:hypothetical protein